MKSIVVLSFFLLTGSSLFPILHPDPMTEEALGEKLFFDKSLSKDGTVSCADCHRPEFAFADTSAFSIGVGGALGQRNTPSVMNMAFRPYFFYDGRAGTLEEQAIGPIENPLEMDLKYAEAVKRIKSNEDYRLLFKEVYGGPPDSANIVSAIAAFIRTLESDGSAPSDLWLFGNENAMTASQVNGREIFLNKGKCFDCHFSPDFTGDEFRNVGLYDGAKYKDRGRFDITKDSSDLGKFKVPGLRNVALTAPYMHNGMFRTLEEVVEYYDNPYLVVPAPINMDSLLVKPLQLTKQEKEDLVNYLHALTDATFPFK